MTVNLSEIEVACDVFRMTKSDHTVPAPSPDCDNVAATCQDRAALANALVF